MKDNRKIWIWVAIIVIVILAVWGISAANKNETAAEDKIQEQTPAAEQEDSGIETEAPDSQTQADQEAAAIEELEGTEQE
ncbi:hypothetical protein [Faecalibaculum rodentium]|mgnify:FL=1|uniref:hypothetical protein n=1 Tax=Faecalibaculum rodentium TaxID=1702221 RepID=UPI00258FB9C9|nr:hypothetical protein [Faecalibaculum rodentium]